MISCEHAQNLFDLYLKDELSPALTTELNAHLLDCSSCQHRYSLMEACGNVIRLDINEPQVSGDFTDRLMAIIDESAPHRRSLQLRRGMKIAGGLLGVAAAIALVMTLYPDRPAAPGSRVAGDQYNPPQVVPVAESISNAYFPFGLFEVFEQGASVVELGNVGMSKLSGPFDGEGVVFDELWELAPVPTHPEPELDVIETLPALEDGGEML